ncbi:two-partner secretion domain-containing protein [Thiobacillus sp.]
MNHIYRSLWNAKTGTFVAVSEIVTSGKKASTGGGVVGGVFALKALAVSLLLGFGSTSYALPVGGVVAAGSAAVTTGTGGMTVNQSSQNAVLNWQSFNIGQGEAVRFVQPNSSSVALNRVIGADPSSILGSLTANGKVFLVNPNGILFGAGASVNVGGLVASTRNISDSDFMAGNYRFAGSGSGAVVNQGSIHADGGYVALLGANVSNQGVIAARLGTVALAAGNAVTLDVAGDGLLNVTVDQGAVNALVQNGGMLQADGGQVLMTAQAAGNLLQTVVNNTGVIQAQTIENHNGVIKLVGDMQSGTVNVGGTLDASAPNGGNGGFIETSAAHVKVNDTARITTSAPQGLTGSWLIDPADFTIAATGGDMTGAALSTSLGTTDVTIYSTSGSTGTAGDVNVNDVVSWSSHKLTLNAQNNININTAMSASGTASLALEYGQAAVAAGNTNTVNVNAPINLPTGNNFSTKLGSDGGTVNYMVITDLGAAGDIGAITLQGINGNLAGNYVLGANIDASATNSWNSGAGFDPVGKPDVDPDPFNPFDSPIPATPFTGTFDGLGHTISGLTINRPSQEGVGLFGQVNGADLRNVGLLGGSITGKREVGSLVGDSQNSTIRQAYATSAVNGGEVVGGLVGNSQNSTIRQAYTTGAVSGGGSGSGGSGAGVGGLVGQNINTPISQAYATGTVHGGSCVGGLLGYNLSGSTITDAYASGAVSGSSYAGGLVGSNASGGTITAGYWDSYSTGRTAGVGYGSAAGITAITSDSAQAGAANYAFKKSAYAGFNFTTTPGATGNNWVMVDVDGSLNNTGGALGATRPMLASEYSTTINNAHQLQLMAMDMAANYTLAQNINAAATGTPNDVWSGSTFIPVGISTFNTFTGVFDGLGHTINGLTINRPGTDYTGMFRLLRGTVRNIGLVGGSTVGGQFTGALAGRNYGTISNSYATGTVSGTSQVGGLVGLSNSGTISDSHATGAVTGSGNYVGGLAGGSYGTMSNSYATGIVSGHNFVGGLAGAANGSGINNSYATGAVSGSTYVGGLVGYNAATTSNSYATGAVSGTDAVGGLVGYNNGTISKTYATGAVTGSTRVGGLVGLNLGTSNTSFWDITTTGQTTSAGGGKGMSTANLQLEANFTSATVANGNANPAWDTTSTWVIYDAHTAPLLRLFMTALTVTANDATRTYDATAYGGGNGVSYSSTPDSSLLGTLSYGGSSQGSVNAGSYAITPGGLYSTHQQGGYAITFVSGTLTINPEAGTDNSAGPSAESGGNITKIQNAITNASSMEFVNSNENNIASSLVSSGLGTVGVPNASATPGDVSVASMLAGLNITVKEHGVNSPFGEQDKDKKYIAD